MSYILDALKKAERQRHLAQVPTVATIHRTPAVGSQRSWPWILAAVVVLANAAVLGWLLRPTAVIPIAPPSSATQTASTVPEDSPPTRIVAAPAPPESHAVAPRPSVPAAGKASPPNPRPDAVAPRSGALDRKPTAAKPVDPKPAPSVALAPTAPSAQPPSSKPEAGPPAAQPAPTAKPAETSAAPTTAAPAAKSTERAVAAPQSPAPREAAGSASGTLPEMRLQMLVYSDVPSERLVFINNQKYVEGQSVDGKLVVESITPEGAVVNYQGKRVLLRAEPSATR